MSLELKDAAVNCMVTKRSDFPIKDCLDLQSLRGCFCPQAIDALDKGVNLAQSLLTKGDVAEVQLGERMRKQLVQLKPKAQHNREVQRFFAGPAIEAQRKLDERRNEVARVVEDTLAKPIQSPPVEVPSSTTQAPIIASQCPKCKRPRRPGLLEKHAAFDDGKTPICGYCRSGLNQRERTQRNHEALLKLPESNPDFNPETLSDEDLVKCLREAKCRAQTYREKAENFTQVFNED